VWFAEALLSSATAEIRPLLVRARDWAKRLVCRPAVDVGQTRCVRDDDRGDIPGKPHRYCGNHFLRDLAKPMLELDSQPR